MQKVDSEQMMVERGVNGVCFNVKEWIGVYSFTRPRSILLHWNKHRLHHVPPSFARCPVFAFTFIFHTIRLILCFQQAEEINNLPVSLGQNSLIVLCRFHVSTRVAPRVQLTTFWALLIPPRFDNLGFLLRENCCCTTWYLPLGVSQRTCGFTSSRTVR